MSDTIHISDFEQPVFEQGMLDIINSLEEVPIPLDNESLIQLAKDQLDVPFHHDQATLDRFQAWFQEALANGPTHKLGLMAIQQIATEGLADISRMHYLEQTYPEIKQQSIERPIIVAGMPRSGTTHLMKLLSTEPSLRTAKRWQTFQAFPSKAMLEGSEPDNRKENGALRDEMTNTLLPHLRGLFDVGATDSTEEIEAMLKACYGVTPSFQGNLPNFDKRFYSEDQTEAYQFLYRYLRALQWVEKDESASRWLLKSPQHMAALPAIKNVFPDACMVFTHRDPASVFTSLITMIGYNLRCMYSSCTKEQIIEKTRRMQHGFLRGIVNDIDKMDGPVEHVYFDRFMGNKVETVERIFETAGIEMDDATRGRVTEAARTQTRGRLGRYVYDLEGDFGLTRDEIREEFSYYIDRFDVAIEETHQ